MTTVRVHRAIGEIPAEAWNALLPEPQPFVRHEFLHALEATGCIRRELGWVPHHVALYEGRTLVAAAPCYLKANSHGEFVFDHAWAELHHRTGREYYPKLLCAVPYTPVAGPRLLVGPSSSALDVDIARSASVEPGGPSSTPAGVARAGADGAPAAPAADARRDALVAAMLDVARRAKCSSVHVNFARADDAGALQRAGLFPRVDCQFHWGNDGYRDFDAFLDALTAKRRKEVRRERARFADGRWRHRWVAGDALDSAQLAFVYASYVRTFSDKGNYPALTEAFFGRIAGALGDRVQVALAEHDGEPQAMAFCLRDEQALYGRYWGAAGYVPVLHFETCFYQGIAWCIEHGLPRFEPGAQGEHKIARGFLPVRTQSLHAVFDRTLEPAIRGACEREARWLDRYEASVLAHSPYAQRPE